MVSRNSVQSGASQVAEVERKDSVCVWKRKGRLLNIAALWHDELVKWDGKTPAGSPKTNQ
jgi:hypothetical protein